MLLLTYLESFNESYNLISKIGSIKLVIINLTYSCMESYPLSKVHNNRLPTQPLLSLFCNISTIIVTPSQSNAEKFGRIKRN